MPVTVILSSHKPKPLNSDHCYAKSPLHLLHQACPLESVGDAHIVASSFEGLKAENRILPSSGSFVRGAVEAWARHYHLILRPDDVWFAILSQMNFYMKKNAENLRHIFVDHKGQKPIRIEGMHIVDMLGCFTNAIQAVVKTRWLKSWAMPAFSTTTKNNTMVANILLMGLMEKYFSYFMEITCGLPSVT